MNRSIWISDQSPREDITDEDGEYYRFDGDNSAEAA